MYENDDLQIYIDGILLIVELDILIEVIPLESDNHRFLPDSSSRDILKGLEGQ